MTAHRLVARDPAKLLEVRLALGLQSQEALLERSRELYPTRKGEREVGSIPTISRAENGEPIWASSAYRIARALGRPLGELFVSVVESEDVPA